MTNRRVLQKAALVKDETLPYESSAWLVEVDGKRVGRVLSKRTESWRQLRTGVRYSLRGRPLHWEAWRGMDRVGFQFSSRKAAVEALLK